MDPSTLCTKQYDTVEVENRINFLTKDCCLLKKYVVHIRGQNLLLDIIVKYLRAVPASVCMAQKIGCYQICSRFCIDTPRIYQIYANNLFVSTDHE